ncbi:MAG TPA: glycosyl hydrolase, partial [Planctomycetaceae bacterium]|nr:glycosyl hydrolase [Planctomycetaceae bacterium]
AAAQVVEFRPTDDQVVQQLLELVTPQERPEIATGMIAALTRSRSPRIGDSVLDAVALLTPSARKAAFGVLLARPETTRALLASAEAGKVQLTELALDQQSALRTHPDEKIKRRAVELLRKGGNLPDPDREKVLQSLLPLTEKTGSVQGGLAVFKKHCAKCHKHNGFGESIGPDLTGMAVHPKHELLTHIIDPSRSVEGNFRIYSVATEDGQILTGMLASESRTSIELIDAEAKRHTILREDIDELRASKKSLMPEGFEKSVKQAEIADLLEYLTHKGRFVPLSIAKIATAISTKGLFHNGDNGADRMIFPDWKPKVFAGVPFLLTDPQGKSTPNLVLLHGPLGSLPPGMPKSVALPCNTRAEKIHLLSGVSGWGFPYSQDKSVSMIVRLHYDDGQVEDHPLINGVHFADYIRRVDVPKSQFAYLLRGQQIRHLFVEPKRDATIEEIAFVKGPDQSAPMIMAVTVERKDPRAAE